MQGAGINIEIYRRAHTYVLYQLVTSDEVCFLDVEHDASGHALPPCKVHALP